MEFQEICRQRDALKCSLTRSELEETKAQRRIALLDNEVARYATECQRLARVLGESGME